MAAAPLSTGVVHRLSESLVAKIAAGEVIERPASILKELLENSIDASARSIHVRLLAGGIRLIEVRDDGIGMSPEDARLSLERHATSKIGSEDDLYSIRSLGFRGEALPSIAAVSKLTLRTRTREAEHGFRVDAHGSNIVKEEPCALEPGTWLSAAEIFFNTPARRKFLKSERSELGAAVQVLSRIALSRPELEFRLDHEDSRLVDFPRADLARRTCDVIGSRVEGKLVALRHREGPLEVTGLIGTPLVHWPNGAGLYLYLNGRYFRDRLLNHAVHDAFAQTLPGGRYPVGVVYLSLDPRWVDVNVHPQKLEVRFKDAGEVFRIVRHAAREALGPRLFAPQPEPSHAEINLPQPPDAALIQVSALQHPLGPAGRPRDTGHSKPWGVPRPDPYTENVLSPSRRGRLGGPQPSDPDVAQTAPRQSDGFVEPVEARAVPTPVTVIGQLRHTFILCESDNGLIVVDQHTAHERILFEKLKDQLRDGGVARQSLLMPEIYSPPPQEATVILDLLPILDQSGFSVEPFGSSFAVKAIPAGLSVSDAVGFLADLVRNSREMEIGKKEDPRETLLDLIACRAAVKAGDELSAEEQERLVSQVYGTSSAFTCPHGRPVLLEWSYDTLERAFKRR